MCHDTLLSINKWTGVNGWFASQVSGRGAFDMGVRLVGEHESGAPMRVYEEIRARLGLGLVPNVFKAMAAVNLDVLVQNWTAFRCTLLEGGLPRTVKEMIGVIVSRRNRCAYSLEFHARRLVLLGVPGPIVDSLIVHGDAEQLTDATRAMLAFARSCADDPDRADPGLMEAHGCSDDEIQEVTDTVLMVAGMNRFSKEMGVPMDSAS